MAIACCTVVWAGISLTVMWLMICAQGISTLVFVCFDNIDAGHLVVYCVVSFLKRREVFGVLQTKNALIDNTVAILCAESVLLKSKYSW